MAAKKTEARLVAEDYCKSHPGATSKALARALRSQHPLLFSSEEAARSIVRVVRGANGNAARKHASAPRERKNPGDQSFPPSLHHPTVPFVVEDPGVVGVISDLHVPYHDMRAVATAIKYLSSRRIKTLVINGDFCDFYQISRFEKSPKARDFASEIESCVHGLKYLRSRFKWQRIIFKWGNHEERYTSYIWQRAVELWNIPQCQLEQILQFEELGIECVKDKRAIMIGKLPILHGHELQRGITAPINPSRGAFLKTLHALLVGHSHKTSTHVETNMFGEEIPVWSTGMLCGRESYNLYSKSNLGFAVVSVHADGRYDVDNCRISNGKVYRS